jgi:hypothetical protein
LRRLLDRNTTCTRHSCSIGIWRSFTDRTDRIEVFLRRIFVELYTSFTRAAR